MGYMEDLYSAGYIAEHPENPSDILLMPKSISSGCEYSLFVNRDTFVDTLKKQRCKDGMNEAILSSILEAPEKQEYAVFNILLADRGISEIYMRKQAFLHPEKVHEEISEVITSAGKARERLKFLEVEEEDNADYKQTGSETVTPLMSEPPNLDIKKAKFLGEVGKSLDDFCTALPLVRVDEVNPIEEKTPENTEKYSEYQKLIETVSTDLKQLSEKNVLYALFSLGDTPIELKESFAEGISEILPELAEDDRSVLMQVLLATFFGVEVGSDHLREAILRVIEVGVSTYRFDSVNKVCKIVLDFFHKKEEE